ncbi:MAG: diphthamide biosynthesis enzyme Dph2 [Candidatus Undinarchaeales archaeon]
MDAEDLIKEANSEIKKNKAEKVALQLPDGLKSRASDISAGLDAEAIVLAGSCFGACDLKDREANELGCDLLLHFGHADFGLKTEIPVSYIEAKSEKDISKLIEKASEKIKETKIGLVAVVQFVHQLEKAKKILEGTGKEVFIAEPKGHSKYKGHILGCDIYSATSISDKVDAFLYIGGGEFHPLPIAVETGKKVYLANPEQDKIEKISGLKDKFLRKRFAQIELAKKAEKFGILATTKKGQNRVKLAEKLKKMIEKEGKKAVILVFNTINPSDLINYRLDAYVNTACPRIAMDTEQYDKPLLSPIELEIGLGKRKWENYKLDRF